MITNDASAIVLNSVISATLDKISIISLRNSEGEYFRKTATDIVNVNTTKRVFTFFLAENDGNGEIVEIGLHGNGATTELNSGTCYATQQLIVSKDSFQSLTIDWTVNLT